MVSPSTHSIAPAHRAIGRTMLNKVPELADRFARLLSEQDDFYREVYRVAPDELRKVCEANFTRALRAFIDGEEPALDAARKTGRAQALKGIPLSAVLRAFRLAGSFVYQDLLEQADLSSMPADQILQISSQVWQTIDVYSASLASAYNEVATESEQHDEWTRRSAWLELLAGHRLEPSAVHNAAQVLGLPMTGRFVVVAGAAAADDRAPEADGTDTNVTVSEAGEAAPVQVSRLLRSTGYQSAWRTGPGSEIGIVVVERDLRTLREALESTPVAVGVSTPFGSLRDVPAAVERARLAQQCVPPGVSGVAVYGDTPVTTLVAGAPTLAREVALAPLAGVLELPEAERTPLLDTLRVWYETAGSAKVAAGELFVHPNTVRYRMRRVQELTSLDVSNPVAVAELYVALEAHRFAPS
ncbi:PucR family transcriptional regulator [Allosaccharopolyspora coralli]|uniref:PucR family transcriptional regulator n=1 Tax=Allosaccharopolyspora coralli TaxID=2665642 RepID=A0A5Q3Q615_9PSEU|nr:helix-turn-helix domain-containing protein [Allosaccharopolyspora coralli]QGK68906.1 PucR family transcriptional regulator [Allosaccharopolyspora coralli]